LAAFLLAGFWVAHSLLAAANNIHTFVLGKKEIGKKSCQKYKYLLYL
jgi:hypothetical protein